MGLSIRARLRRGVLEPLEKLNLPDGAEVTVSLTQSSEALDFEAFRRSAGGWKDTFDAESLIREIYDSRLVSDRKEPHLATTPVSNIPQILSERVPSRGVAYVGRSIIIRGELSGSESLYIDGQVEGAIELRDHNLTIGPNGRIDANINAKEIVIEGSVKGNVRAIGRVEIRRTGSLAGDMVAERIAIEDGAFFKGSIDIQIAGESHSKPSGLKEAGIPSPEETQNKFVGAGLSPRKVR
ncbi:MAG: polymer-forming cytoskeletal protein [Acidobacteria bacterium]|nr:polymer-forming cytoskeletal protein [Acidobacteriota bacterium]